MTLVSCWINNASPPPLWNKLWDDPQFNSASGVKCVRWGGGQCFAFCQQNVGHCDFPKVSVTYWDKYIMSMQCILSSATKTYFYCIFQYTSLIDSDCEFGWFYLFDLPLNLARWERKQELRLDLVTKCLTVSCAVVNLFHYSFNTSNPYFLN